MSNEPGLVTPHSPAARLLAAEVLLAGPEALADDCLESCLYILRDRLRAELDPAARPPGRRPAISGNADVRW